MRFKRLKIVVAVCLVLFMFITANIVVFGLIQNKIDSQNLIAAPDNKQLVVPASVSTTPTQTQIPTQNTQTTTNTPAANNPPFVFHVTRTRAS